MGGVNSRSRFTITPILPPRKGEGGRRRLRRPLSGPSGHLLLVEGFWGHCMRSCPQWGRGRWDHCTPSYPRWRRGRQDNFVPPCTRPKQGDGAAGLLAPTGRGRRAQRRPGEGGFAPEVRGACFGTPLSAQVTIPRTAQAMLANERGPSGRPAS